MFLKVHVECNYFISVLCFLCTQIDISNLWSNKSYNTSNTTQHPPSPCRSKQTKSLKFTLLSFVDIQVNPLRGVSWFQGVRVSDVQKICSEANVKYLRIYLSVALQDTPVSFTQIYQYNSINSLARSTVTCPSILPVYFSSLVVQITNCNEHTTLPLRDITKCFFNVFLTMNFYDERHREH